MYTVDQIHADFDSAQERLVAEATRIVNKKPVDLIEKGERLKSIGFTSAKPVSISEVVLSRIAQSKEFLSNLSDYQVRYPDYKFITDSEVERLCKKYGLVFGPANKYIGDIPEKNIREIESFRLLEEDYIVKDETFTFTTYVGSIFHSGRWADTDPRPNIDFGVTYEKSPEKIKPDFKIVAPKKDFDTSNMTLKGYVLEENLPDPIVLQPVKGGYLIVSKWGIEGNDESLTNELMN